MNRLSHSAFDRLAWMRIYSCKITTPTTVPSSPLARCQFDSQLTMENLLCCLRCNWSFKLCKSFESCFIFCRSVLTVFRCLRANFLSAAWSRRSWSAACCAARHISSLIHSLCSFGRLWNLPNSISNGLHRADMICVKPISIADQSLTQASP